MEFANFLQYGKILKKIACLFVSRRKEINLSFILSTFKTCLMQLLRTSTFLINTQLLQDLELHLRANALLETILPHFLTTTAADRHQEGNYLPEQFFILTLP